MAPPPLLPPPPRSANASRRSSRSSTPTPPLTQNQFTNNAFASSSSNSPRVFTNTTNPAAQSDRQENSSNRTRTREETSFTEESDTSFGSFSGNGDGDGFGDGSITGVGNAGKEARLSVDLMDFSSKAHALDGIMDVPRMAPPMPSNIHRLQPSAGLSRSSNSGSNVHVNGEADLLGSFDDHTPIFQSSSRTNNHSNQHHDGVIPNLVRKNDREEEVLRSKMSERGGGVDPRLLPYRGPDADIPSVEPGGAGLSESMSATYPIPFLNNNPIASPINTSPTPTTRPQNPSAHTHSPAPPPRRLSQFQSFSGPSSPPAISAQPGDSFVFRPRTHSFGRGVQGGHGGEDGDGDEDEDWGKDQVELRMAEAIEDGRTGQPRGDGNGGNRRTSVIDLLEDYEGSGQVYGQSNVLQNASGSSHQRQQRPRIGTEDAASGFRRLSASSSSSPPPAMTLLGSTTRRLSSSFLRGPTGVGLFPRKVSSPGKKPVAGADEDDVVNRVRANGNGKRGKHEKSVTLPAYSTKRGESNEHPFSDEPDDVNDGGGEWGSYRRSPTSGGDGTSLAGMTKKFGLASLTGASKATDTFKSKWKTVLGPGTFSGSPTSPSSFASGSGSSNNNNNNNFNTMRLGLDQDKIEEFEKPSFTAQPISITSETPFHLRDDSQGGHFWAAPNGAPGFRNPNGLMSDLAPLPGTENRHGRVEDWSGTKLKGRREMTTPVLDEHCADALRPSLPARQRLSNTWTLLFSLDQHGGSISTFYRLIETHAQTHKFAGNLLVIRDTEDRRFGVYMNESIRRVDGSYFGSGESWLFKIIGDDLDVRARAFKWTGRNQYFALCEGGFISFGGGDGKTGLYLDGSFVSGTSARCPAYDNEVLCADEGSLKTLGRFDCVGLEVWATS